MSRIQLEHIIRPASQISDDPEIVVIGSRAIHAQTTRLPPIAFHSIEADVYPRNHPERADDIDAAIGELSSSHATHGYYAHGTRPRPPFFPQGGNNASFASALRTPVARPGFASTCMTSRFRNTRRGRERDIEFNRELVRHGIVSKRRLTRLVPSMPIEDERKRLIFDRIKRDFAEANPRGDPTSARQ